MSDTTILMRNTMRITPGHLREFQAAIDKAVGFVAENGPQLMVRVFIDEPQLVAHSFQLYADSDAVLTQWQLSDPYIQQVMAHCEVERLDIYGTPDERVTAGLEQFTQETGAPVSITPQFTGFTR